MPKAKQSLNDLLYDIKRIEEHREVLTEKKIRAIFQQVSKELTAFVGEEYVKHADENGTLSFSTLQSRARQARFIEEAAEKVDSITPEVHNVIMSMVDTTYKNCYEGMAKAVSSASNTADIAAMVKGSLIKPEVLKQTVDNNITKLTLSPVLEKHRQEIVYNIKQELTIGLVNGDRYDKMAKRLTEKVDISYGKATRIVRTESHRNIESGFFDCAENLAQKIDGSGLVSVCTWRTMKDERVRPYVRRKTKKGWKTYKSTNGADHVKMEGKTIRVGDFFVFSDGVKTKAPSKSGEARHDCNCRCFLEYDVMTEEEFAKVNANAKKPAEPEKKEETKVEKPAESGIIKEQAKPTTEKQQIEVSDFPSALTKGAEKKNTQTLVDYINGLDAPDANVLNLYKSMGKMDNISAFKVSHGKNHAVSYSYSSITGELREAKLCIPKLSGDNIAGQVVTTLHEEMHLIDLYARKEGTVQHFSACFEPLTTAVRTSTSDIGAEVKSLFAEHKKAQDAVRQRVRAKYNALEEELKLKYYPDGKMDIWHDLDTYDRFNKERKKLRNKMYDEMDYEGRNVMGGGIGSLEDIYDALSGGAFRDSGVVQYGHGRRYYASRSARVHEIVANYGALSVTRPDLIALLRKDKPELCSALDKFVIELLKKAGA